jgi:hypothetical protein
LWWHVKQAKIENEDHKKDVEKWGGKDALLKSIDKEDPEFP